MTLKEIAYVSAITLVCAAGCASQNTVAAESRGAVVAPEQHDLFVSGTEGYHTFRIPALEITKKGTLLAFCEGRKAGQGDSGAIDTVLKRSTDNGKTWLPLQVVAPGGEDTFGNPCPIVDRNSGTIVLLLTKNEGSAREGLIVARKDPPRTVWITRSTDDGATWQPPTDISAQARNPEWGWYATGPCHGIQLAGGRLVAPCDHSEGTEDSAWRSHVIYSDDGGASWQLGGSAEGKTDESTVVELDDGSLCLNMRNHDQNHKRKIARSTDGGLTWSPIAEDPALLEPVCQASILKLPAARKSSSSSYLFSNPASEKRMNMSIRVSDDACKTWSEPKTLWPGPAAYSDLVVSADKRIGCLYERGKNSAYEVITMAMFTQEWLREGP